MHVRIIAHAAALVGISALAFTPPLHAQETPDELRALAEQGDAPAQNNLGFMYDNGEGVPQDDVEAHMWYNCPPSAPMRQIAGIEQRRISGSSSPPRSGDETEIRNPRIVV